MAEQAPKRTTSIQEQIAKYGAELTRLNDTLDLAFANGAKSTKAPEDRVIFPLLVSCRDILDEILFAVNGGLGRAALRSARTMYECVVICRHLHLHPEKTVHYLDKMWVQWAKVLQNIPKEQRSPKMHQALSAKVPKYAAGNKVGSKELDWSGANTRKMAGDGQLAHLHSLAFDYASAYVHPSAMFLLSTLSQPVGGGNLIHISERPQDDEAEHALRVAHDLILNAVDLRLKYLPSDSLKQRFEECKQDFVNIWDYPPHI